MRRSRVVLSVLSLAQGRGTLTVTQASCRTEVATDPATGITGGFEI